MKYCSKKLEDLNTWKDSACSRTGTTDIVKMQNTLTGLQRKYNTFQNPRCLFCFVLKKSKLIPKFIWQCKGARTGKTTLKKKSKVGVVTLPSFKT